MEYLLKLTREQLAILGEGMASVPYGRAAPVVAAIGQQVDEQDKAAAQAAAAAMEN
ncbi:hypothetical protein LGM89_00655 [Burkholderia sp. AU31624]|uniref:hypothetical protein n=1 Tax=Burkholderia sp. AU31624 TaxID=2879629 RepID=UPI001CF565C6|nr:hypothetical protein [Burkholderia sp. AU31624]MCA8251760.1 hypothetical protein [Burkholderia sp. AU31624]